MVLHVKHVPKRSEGKSSLGANSVELYSREGLLSVHTKVSQCPTSVKNEKAYWYEAFWGRDPK